MSFKLTPRHRIGPLEQVLRKVASVRYFPQPHHPAGAFERVQLAPQLGRRFVIQLRARHELTDSIHTVAGFFEEEREQVVVDFFQIFVQFRRFTSIPRVPTISSSASRTATAIVKQGSEVNNES